jgi:hypothetical protein
VPGTVMIRLVPADGQTWTPLRLTINGDIRQLADFSTHAGFPVVGGDHLQGVFRWSMSWTGAALSATSVGVDDVQSLVRFAKPAAFSWKLTENGTTIDVGNVLANTGRIILTPVTVALDIVLIPVYLIILASMR